MYLTTLASSRIAQHVARTRLHMRASSSACTCKRAGSSAHNGKLLFAMWSFGLYFPVATTSGVLMQPDDPSLDVNTKPIWDITLKLG